MISGTHTHGYDSTRCSCCFNVNFYILGEMDDVLDNICPIHECGSIYRYVSLLVSDLCVNTAL